MISFLSFIQEHTTQAWPTHHTLREMEQEGYVDMLVLIDDFLAYRYGNISIDETQPLIHNQVVDWDFDYRGQEQVNQFKKEIQKGTKLPPVILYNGMVDDGRHRILAAHELGLPTVPSIHLEDYAIEGEETYEKH